MAAIASNPVTRLRPGSEKQALPSVEELQKEKELSQARERELVHKTCGMQLGPAPGDGMRSNKSAGLGR